MSLEAETRRCLEGEAMARAELEELVRKHDEVLRGALDESTRVRSEVRLRETRLLGNVSSLEEKVGSPSFGLGGLGFWMDGHVSSPREEVMF